MFDLIILVVLLQTAEPRECTTDLECQQLTGQEIDLTPVEEQ